MHKRTCLSLRLRVTIKCCRSHCLVQVCSRAVGNAAKRGMMVENGVPVALCVRTGTGIALQIRAVPCSPHRACHGTVPWSFPTLRQVLTSISSWRKKKNNTKIHTHTRTGPLCADPGHCAGFFHAVLQPNNERCFVSLAEEYYARHRGPKWPQKPWKEDALLSFPHRLPCLLD